mgnify:FL=1
MKHSEMKKGMKVLVNNKPGVIVDIWMTFGSNCDKVSIKIDGVINVYGESSFKRIEQRLLK